MKKTSYIMPLAGFAVGAFIASRGQGEAGIGAVYNVDGLKDAIILRVFQSLRWDESLGLYIDGGRITIALDKEDYKALKKTIYK